MSKRSATSKSAERKPQSFAHLLSQDPELAGLRAEYSQKPASERRAAAEWAYDESLAASLFGAAVARLQGEGLPSPNWPPGFAALAADPEYAPALLTVGCSHQQEFIIGMGWALCRAGKQAEALPWLEKAVANAPLESSVLSDYGWALTELGRFEEAQPILEKAVRLAPPEYDLPANNLKKLRQLQQERGRDPQPQ